MEIKRALHHFLQTTFLRGDGAALSDGTSLLRSGLLDSTDQLELVLFLEEEFGLTVSEEEAGVDNLDSVERIAAFVARKRAALAVSSDPGPGDERTASRE